MGVPQGPKLCDDRANQFGADINAVDSINGTNTLWAACRGGKGNVAVWLLAQGADISAVHSSKGTNALWG